MENTNEWDGCPYNYHVHLDFVNSFPTDGTGSASQLDYHKSRVERCWDWKYEQMKAQDCAKVKNPVDTKHPIVVVSDGRSTTTSLNVADVFTKRHDNVLKTIQGLEIPEDFRLLNFEESYYTNGQNKKQPMVKMTRDGFTVLVMGFTGSSAMEFKLKYIDEFNRMESALKNGNKKKKDQKTADIAREFRAFKSIAMTAGLKGNFAVLSANQAMIKHAGINPLEMIGTEHLAADSQIVLLTPTDIAMQLGIKRNEINPILIKNGFQISIPVKKGKAYEPTEKGIPFAVMLDTGKKHSSGTPVKQLKWKSSIVGLIQIKD